MFDNGNTFRNNGGENGSQIIKSGYDTRGQLQSLGSLKNKFAEALSFKESDCNKQTLEKYARIEGEVRGLNSLAKRVSRKKLDAARAISQSHQILWQHAQAAAQLEMQWQKTAATNLEKMSENLLDMDTQQRSHSGFASYNDVADKMITY